MNINSSSLANQRLSPPSPFGNAASSPPPENFELQLPDALRSDPAASSLQDSPDPDELKDAFSNFVGQTFFGEMIKAYRTTQQPSAYFNGGRAEEIFQGQFDQVLTEKLSEASAEKIADPLFELFMLKRAS